MMREGRMVLGGMLFATLLNFKHIYMYIAVRLNYRAGHLTPPEATLASVFHLSTQSSLHNTSSIPIAGPDRNRHVCGVAPAICTPSFAIALETLPL
jgi:hypothetical protein